MKEGAQASSFSEHENAHILISLNHPFVLRMTSTTVHISLSLSLSLHAHGRLSNVDGIDRAIIKCNFACADPESFVRGG